MSTEAEKTIDVHLTNGRVIVLDATGSSDDEVIDAMRACVNAESGALRGPRTAGPQFAMIPARSILYCEARGLDAQDNAEVPS